MAILDDDDVNEVKNVNEQEIKMDSYIKKIIENVLEVQLKEHKEIASIAKTKIAEVTLELEKLNKPEGYPSFIIFIIKESYQPFALKS